MTGFGISEAVALTLISKVYGFAIIIASLELLYLARRGEFSESGAWSWSVVSASVRPRIDVLHFFFHKNHSVHVLVFSRFIAAMVLMASSWGEPWVAPALAVLLLSQLSLNMRIIWGDDGSDQMLGIIVIALFIAAVFVNIPLVTTLSLFFISCQLTLSYFCSGSAKLFGASWRDGAALGMIMGHYAYGNRKLHLLLTKHVRLGRLATYSVIVFQLSFPLYFLLPMPTALGFLLLGFIFHLGIALVMRLNGFLFSFCAGYPALLYTHSYLDIPGMVFGGLQQ